MANMGPGGMGISNPVGSPMQMRQAMGGSMQVGLSQGSTGASVPMGSPGSLGSGPGPTQPQNSGQSSSQLSSQQEAQLRFDSVARVRMLVGSLKESLSEVVRVAAMNIYHTAAVDNGVRTSSDASPQRLDKALEEFFNICNQIEFNLKTIQECVLQEKSAQHYLPIPVHPNKQEPFGHQETAMSYSQFLTTIGSQMAFAKDLQEILAESASRIRQQRQPPQTMFR